MVSGGSLSRGGVLGWGCGNGDTLNFACNMLGLFLGFRILTFTSFVRLGEKKWLFCGYWPFAVFFFFVFFFSGGWGEGCHFQNLLFLSIKILGMYLGIVRIRVRNFC